MSKEKNTEIGFFSKYLTIWVALCMVAGVLIGKFLPGIPDFFDQFEYANISIPTAILIWVMIYPMMMKVDFQSIKNVRKNPKGLYVTWITNWLIKPFTMYGLAVLFFYVIFKGLIPVELAKEYLAGAVLLGAAPCTAMVFVWSQLTKGNPAYTVVQVATNDLIILVTFIPIVKFLLGVSDVSVPWDTLIMSVVLFVVIPLTGGILTRIVITNRRGLDYFENRFLPKFDNVTTVGLLLMLVLLFSFQGDVILGNPLHILLIAIPLTIQTFLIFFVAYIPSRLLKLPHNIAAPAGMIGASNFFELAVAVAIALFGMDSPAALATTVGVLTEVPIMLILVKIADNTTQWFPERAKSMGNIKAANITKIKIKRMEISYMKRLEIFEPAMCCPTGLCGVEMDPELLRVSAALNSLEQNGIKVERYNLSSSPQNFINNVAVTDFIRANGAEALPVAVFDGEIIIRGRYPKNEEFVQLLNIPLSYLENQQEEAQGDNIESEEGCCGGGCCCSEGCC